MKGLKEIHEIMERIHDDEKDLSNIQRMKMLKEESD